MKRILILMLLATSVSMMSCNSTTGTSDEATTAVEQADIMVYYFHYTRRCATCNAVEDVTRLALKEYYEEKMKNGDIAFQSINIEEKEGEATANKLEIAGQALVIVKGDQLTDLTEKGFLYAVSEPEKLKAEVKIAIDAVLN